MEPTLAATCTTGPQKQHLPTIGDQAGVQILLISCWTLSTQPTGQSGEPLQVNETQLKLAVMCSYKKPISKLILLTKYCLATFCLVLGGFRGSSKCQQSANRCHNHSWVYSTVSSNCSPLKSVDFCSLQNETTCLLSNVQAKSGGRRDFPKYHTPDLSLNWDQKQLKIQGGLASGCFQGMT